jgi:hypothetical protein
MKVTTRTVAAGNGQPGYGRIKATALVDGGRPSIELANADGVPMSPSEARQLAAKLYELADIANEAARGMR